jgi:S-adenosylmethionine:tRNA ribosyltransferase-isomerase
LSFRVDDFDFDPPRALTAPRPASSATPLVCCSFPRSWRFEDRQITDLPASSRADDLLLFNDTKVIPARLTRWPPATAFFYGDACLIELG